MIPIDNIIVSPDKRVHRTWTENPDGTFTWRKRADVIWNIERKNVAEPPEKKTRAMVSLQKRLFRPWEHPVTLDDFVFLCSQTRTNDLGAYDAGRYVHLASGCYFKARQVNEFIFRDKATWPVRVGSDQGRVWPTVFIKRYGRVYQRAKLEVVMEVLNGHA